jgi:hypothetical protein
MRKLKLDVDALEVQSFATAAAPMELGTVRGARGETNDGSGCPIDTCTCGESTCCPEQPATGFEEVRPIFPGHGDSDCLATDGVCTCQPIETCSCAATN